MYDTVIVDTPPLLWVGDALTLSSQADGMIVITRMKALRRPMLRELRRILELAPARKLGFVITGPVSGERGVYSYKDGYSYGYGYGYGSSDGRVAGARGRREARQRRRCRAARRPRREGSVRVKATGSDGLSSTQRRDREPASSKA